MNLAIVSTAALVFGCSGSTTALHMQDSKAQDSTIAFPSGTLFGGASEAQANALARISADSHNMHIQEIGEIKDLSRKSLNGQKEFLRNQELLNKSAQRLEVSVKQLAESIERTSQKNPEFAERTLQMLEQLSKNQGMGEITLFFPAGASRIGRNSLEFVRLVNFADYLTRENRGRKLLLISIGSASATGDKKFNRKLAKDRAEFPLDIIGKYLVNTPHEIFKVYGTGDLYSPENAKPKEHQRYQYARLIAVYETDHALELPVEPMED